MYLESTSHNRSDSCSAAGLAVEQPHAPAGDSAPRAEEGLESLLRDNARYIRNLIVRRSDAAVLQRTTVDDLYQETVIAALSFGDRFVFHDRRRFCIWINTVVRNVINTARRRMQRGPQTVRIRGARSSGTGVPEDQLVGLQRSPSSVASGHDEQQALRAAMNTLPAHYQHIIVLHKVDQLPLREVAARMGKSRQATCALLVRAVRLLRKRLSDE